MTPPPTLSDPAADTNLKTFSIDPEHSQVCMLASTLDPLLNPSSHSRSSLPPLSRRRRQQPQLHLQPPSKRLVSIPLTMFKCSTPSSSSKSLQRRPWSYQRRSYPMLVSPLQNCTGGFKIKHRLDSGPEISMRGFKSDQVVVLVRSHLPRPFNSTHSVLSSFRLKILYNLKYNVINDTTMVLTLLTPVLGWLSSDRLVDFGPPEVWMSGWVRRNYALGWNTETMDVYPQHYSCEDGIVVGYIQVEAMFDFEHRSCSRWGSGFSMLNLCSEFSACSIIMIHTSTWNESESAQVGLGFTDGVFFLWLGPGRRLFDRAPLTLGTPGLCDNYNVPDPIRSAHPNNRDYYYFNTTSKPSRNDRQIKLDAYLGTLYCSKPHWFSEGSSWYDDWLGFTAIIPAQALSAQQLLGTSLAATDN
ncbi:hypothetical protein C8R43DRAFT_1131748 [Mycena crocata]|nr:hypothetical protein C8R43DRAFT_1131748 [Mycena crocata]